MGKDMSFLIEETRTITMLIGHIKDSEQAVYIYLDYPIETVKMLMDENPNWLHEEVVSYQVIHTVGGAIILRKPKIGKYHSSTLARARSKIIAQSPCRSCGGTNVYAVKHGKGKVTPDPDGRFWFCPDCQYSFGRAYKKDPYGENIG